MTIGGGTFSAMNKIVPGVYYRIKTNTTMDINLIERGVVAIPLALSWANQEIFEIDQDSFKQINAKTVFLTSLDDPELLPIREVLCHARKCFVVATGGTQASVDIGGEEDKIKVSARKCGTRGNDLRFEFVKYAPDDDIHFILTIYDKTKETMLYTKDVILKDETAEDDLFNQSYLSFQSRPAGQTDISAYWSKYADERASPVFHTLTNGTTTPLNLESFKVCCQSLKDNETSYNVLATSYYSTTGATNLAFYEEFERFVMEERTKYGNLITGVVYDFNYDNEFMINVNSVNTTSDPNRNIVYWVAGATAEATAYNSLTNMVYDGELQTISYSNNTELVADGLQKGYFLFYHQLNQYRVVKDISSLHTIEDPLEKSTKMKKNIVIRLIDQIIKEVMLIFSDSYLGKAINKDVNRIFLKNDIVERLRMLENFGSLYNVTNEDVVVSVGNTQEEVTVSLTIRPLDVMEILYLTVIIDDSGVYT